jgi:hypothetical protein
MAWVNPVEVEAGDPLTETLWNQDVVANWQAIGGAWTSYTPTWTNLTVGDATQTSAYINAGKLYIVRIGLEFAGNTSISGIPEFTLPDGVSVNAGYPVAYCFAYGALRDVSLGVSFTSPILRSGATAARLRFGTINTSSSYAAADIVSNTIPFTWAINDRIEGQFVFEAA